MTTQPNTGVVPTWTTGDRLRKARVMGGWTVAEFARQVLCSEKTVNNYEADKVKPRALLMEKWASVTGVDAMWLETGKTPTQPDGPSGGLDHDLRARRDSNPKPSDPKVLPLRRVA